MTGFYKKIDCVMSHKKVIRQPAMLFTYTKNEHGQFICPDCGAIKNRQNSMHYHMKKHQEELNHICKCCKKGFLQKQTLDLHIRSKHPEMVKDDQQTKKFKCPTLIKTDLHPKVFIFRAAFFISCKFFIGIHKHIC